jgi:hypothetical protein
MLLFGEMKMSEINCYGDEVFYSEVVSGWRLVQLVNIPSGIGHFTVNGFVIGEGDFGLTNCNDPDFVFSMPPLSEPIESDESTNEFSDEEKLFYKTLDHYKSRMYAYANTCYKLITACVEAGYNSEEDECIAYWLLLKMYESLQKGKLGCYPYYCKPTIYYQPCHNDTPWKLEERLQDSNTLYWIKKANKKTTNQLVYMEYSHWDETNDIHHHIIWFPPDDYCDKWTSVIKPVGSYEQDYNFN